ncbi:MAG: recombinase family protein [Clostridia bacterium]|nr:recombinase family protein [Clostridia bacterium]
MKSDLYAIYLRKSREDIEAEKYGENETLARHEKILTNLAEKKNLIIGKIYREVVSGETISERKEMQKLLKDVENEKWTGVLVVEVERLARGDTSDQGIVSKAFKYSHTKIITPVKTYDPDNEFDEEYFEFGLFMSRREYKTINRRLQRGREISVSEGKFIGSIAPFGYNRIKLTDSKGYTLSINQNEASIVKEIFRLYAFENTTIGSIVRRLNKMNLKPRISKEWTISTVKDILSNPTYIGKIVWNRRKQKKKTQNGHVVISRPRNSNYLIYNGLHESIIDDKTWNLVQEKRKQNTPKVKCNNIIQNPLAGLVFCGKCGKPMQRRPYTKQSKFSTLICSNPKCNNISSKLYIVEEKIIDALKIWLEDYKIDYNFKENLDYDNNKVIEESIITTTKEIQKENSKLTKIYSFLENDIYSKDEFINRSKVIKDNIQNLEFELEQYKLLLQKNLEIKNNRKSFVLKLESIVDLYNELNTAGDKNILLKSVFYKIIYLKNEKAIKSDSDPTTFELHIYPKIPHTVE